MATERSELGQRRGRGGAVDVFGHAGLFVVPLDRPQAISGAMKTVDPPALQPGRGRVGPTLRNTGGLHRYCSGCAHETEHVLTAPGGRGSIPSIRWPAAEPATGTTICLDCGQWRAASFRPSPPGWSEWPRSRIATPRAADPVAPIGKPDDCVSETAAENEGMPPKREPRPRGRSTGPRRLRAVAPSAQMTGS
jgi:hypothetical protein